MLNHKNTQRNIQKKCKMKFYSKYFTKELEIWNLHCVAAAANAKCGQKRANTQWASKGEWVIE